MQQQTNWYCGHCRHGPMNNHTDTHCVNCYRRKDVSSREETHYVSSDRRLNTGSSTACYGSTFGSQTSGTYGRAAPAGVSHNYRGSSNGGYGPIPCGSRKWFCCHCGEGPLLEATNVQCTNGNCQHIKCGTCRVEP